MRNIIITGGELFNKGAQAMVFITVHELKKRYPDHDIYVLSELDLERPEKEKNKYAFKFTGWYPIKFARAQSNWMLHLMCKLRNKKEYTDVCELYSNCDLTVDISGYALGSNWSYATCNRYLDHLEFAKAFNIPVYLMPQSIGPFDFAGEKAQELDARTKQLLSGVKTICAREKTGYEELHSKYRLDNVVLSNDLVLNNKGVDLKNIFNSVPDFVIPEIKDNSVGIVPNGMLLSVKDKKSVLDMYRDIVSRLLEKGYQVYILSHSSVDAELCREIFNMCQIVNKVVLLEDDFSCLEFDELVKCFEFIVASRFHSIVHAYKNGIPCVALGWAIKYYKLMKLLKQEQYCFDMRETVDVNRIIEKIDVISDSIEAEKNRIINNLKAIQEKNVFDILPESL